MAIVPIDHNVDSIHEYNLKRKHFEFIACIVMIVNVKPFDNMAFFSIITLYCFLFLLWWYQIGSYWTVKMSSGAPFTNMD